MIAIRKDYSHKYVVTKTTTTSSTSSPKDKQNNHLETAPPLPIASPYIVQKRDGIKRAIKAPISILERYDYDKGPSKPKLIKMDNKQSESAISSTSSSSSPAVHKQLDKSHVPSFTDEYKEQPDVKVIVAQEVPVVKQEKTPTADAQNINKINNKINIIFQLNDNKSLRKNIILHRRAPKKMVQKITIKEANNNTDEVAAALSVVPEKVVCSIETQTEKACDMNMTVTSPLVAEEPTEHLFFEGEILISLQRATISFFEFNRLGSLLKKGETDFKLIDRIPRRLHDRQIDVDNKFQRLCWGDQNSVPIYVEMRAKQKELDDPEMCPIAFLYCNVYYIDQRRAKFSSVHLDTVKSLISDIIYCCVPESSYFIMAWNEMSLEVKSLVTGFVKYKLTPNLDLAKLASIRQFPKLNYRTKQMNCGKGEMKIMKI